MRCFASAFIAIANTPDTRPPAPDAAVWNRRPASGQRPVIVGIGPLQRQPVEPGKIVDRGRKCKNCRRLPLRSLLPNVKQVKLRAPIRADSSLGRAGN